MSVHVVTPYQGRSAPGHREPESPPNTRSRILSPAFVAANVALADAGYVPIPKGEDRGASLTQHGPRHTQISLRAALGDDFAVIAQDVGHADIGVTHRIYTHVMSLEEGDRARLRALVNGEPLPELKRHRLGTSGETAPVA